MLPGYGSIRAIFPTIPARVLTAILVITIRKNAFTVFGLMFIRLAISLLVSPRVRSSTVSCSRRVRRNCLAIEERSRGRGVKRSRRIAVVAWAGFPERARTNTRHRYRLLPDLKSAADDVVPVRDSDLDKTAWSSRGRTSTSAPFDLRSCPGKTRMFAASGLWYTIRFCASKRTIPAVAGVRGLFTPETPELYSAANVRTLLLVEASAERFLNKVHLADDLWFPADRLCPRVVVLDGVNPSAFLRLTAPRIAIRNPRVLITPYLNPTTDQYQ